MLKCIFLISCLLFPVAAWAIYKPVRVLAPELVSGITCESSIICMDDASRYEEAVKLYDEAIQFVISSVGEIENMPRIIFCSTESCFKSFGFNKASAKAVGVSGIVISPRAWEYYYIRHEIIHHLQAEKMGVITKWQSPAWFTEGMAYLLSQDPRKVLATPNQKYREKFAEWYKLI
ncbi:hypothetical protein MNBD_GAMMA03-2071, partial [hydrothermal vent metagenome]